MKLTTLNTTGFFKKFKFRRERREFRNLSAKAAHDWKIILITFFILVLVLVVLNAIFFLRISSGNVFNQSADTNINQASINTKTLEETNTLFSARAVELEQLLEEGLRSVDPSR